RLEQTRALDDPLWTDTNVLAEQALEPANADVELTGQLLDPCDAPVLDDARSNAHGRRHAGISRRPQVAQERFDDGDTPSIVVVSGHRRAKGIGTGPEDLP